MKNIIRLFALFILLVLLTACNTAQQSDSTQTKTIAPINTQQPTNTPLATDKPSPTFTSTVPDTPKPTNTPEPTNTPNPTNTPTKPPTPTNTPESIVIKGKGADVVDIDIPFDLAIAHITGNKASRHFSIVSYNKNGEYVDLLVNVSDPYEGTVPIGFEGNQITRFEVDAVGEWTIEILPLSSARTFSIPGKIEGTGCDIIVMTNGVPDVAKVTGNAQADHFSIVGYDLSGNYVDLLVNTSDPFEGKVLIDKEIAILVVDSTGPWAIDITTR
jgi:hypothetical protein